jgi:hypothetical protein
MTDFDRRFVADEVRSPRYRRHGANYLPQGRHQSATYFNWKKKCDGLSPTEMRRLKQLEDESAKLRKVVADLSLNKKIASGCTPPKALKPVRKRVDQGTEFVSRGFDHLWAYQRGVKLDFRPGKRPTMHSSKRSMVDCEPSGLSMA